MSLEELRAIQLLIIEHGQKLYATKWQYRTAIESEQDQAALDAIQISFAFIDANILLNALPGGF